MSHVGPAHEPFDDGTGLAVGSSSWRFPVFLITPTTYGMRLRTLPAATLVLVALNLGVAAWSLPRAAALRAERARLEQVLQASTTREADTSSISAQDPYGVRRAALGANLAALDARDPIRNWGYSRAGTAWHAVTAIFVHADWLHLAVNCIPLVILGTCLEQVWGPLWVLGLFLAGGTTGMLADGSLGPPGLLVGSSGAVATLLGACAVRFRTHPIRWGYAYVDSLRLHRGRFEIPLLLLVGLWLLQQLTGLLTHDQASGIAFVSHLSGFALGAVIATVLERSQRPLAA
jgi:membrane associated rhomboid family serine protease